MAFTFRIILFWLDSKHSAYPHPDYGIFFLNSDIIDKNLGVSLRHTCIDGIHLCCSMLAIVVLANVIFLGEFLLWLSGIGAVSAAPGRWFNPWPSTVG